MLKNEIYPSEIKQKRNETETETGTWTTSEKRENVDVDMAWMGNNEWKWYDKDREDESKTKNRPKQKRKERKKLKWQQNSVILYPRICRRVNEIYRRFVLGHYLLLQFRIWIHIQDDQVFSKSRECGRWKIKNDRIDTKREKYFLLDKWQSNDKMRIRDYIITHCNISTTNDTHEMHSHYIAKTRRNFILKKVVK